MKRLVACLAVFAAMTGASTASALVIQGGGCPPLNPDCSGGPPPETGDPKPPAEGKPGLPGVPAPGGGGVPGTPGAGSDSKDDAGSPGPLTDPPRMDPGDTNGQPRGSGDRSGGTGAGGNDTNGDGYYSESEWKACVQRVKQAHPGATSGYIGAFCDTPDGPDSDAPGESKDPTTGSGEDDLGLGAYAAQQGGQNSPSQNGAAQAGGAGLPGIATSLDGPSKPGKPVLPGNALGGLFTPNGDEGPDGNGGKAVQAPDTNCKDVEKPDECIKASKVTASSWKKQVFLLNNGVKVTVDYTAIGQGIVTTTAEKDGKLLAIRAWNIGFKCKLPKAAGQPMPNANPLEPPPVADCEVGTVQWETDDGKLVPGAISSGVSKVEKDGSISELFVFNLWHCPETLVPMPSIKNEQTVVLDKVLGLC